MYVCHIKTLTFVGVLERFKLEGKKNAYDNNVRSNLKEDKLENLYNKAEQLGFSGMKINHVGITIFLLLCHLALSCASHFMSAEV